MVKTNMVTLNAIMIQIRLKYKWLKVNMVIMNQTAAKITIVGDAQAPAQQWC